MESGQAAGRYFNKDVSELDLSESALPVCLIRGPDPYSLFRRRRRRRRVVISS